MRFVFLNHSVSLLLIFSPLMAQETDSIQDIEKIERVYKRDVINQIKTELLKKAIKKEEKVDEQKMQKIEIVATHAYASLSHQLMRLEKSIKDALQNKKNEKGLASQDVQVTFTLYQSDSVIIAELNSIEPADKTYDKEIQNIFNVFQFSPLPVQSPEIKLQLSVSLAE